MRCKYLSSGASQSELMSTYSAPITLMNTRNAAAKCKGSSRFSYFAALLLVPTIATAQQQANLQLDGGVHPYGGYYHDTETVSLSSGNLNLVIPLLSLPGRAGHDLNLSVIYNSQLWSTQELEEPASGSSGPSGPPPLSQYGFGWKEAENQGWSFPIPSLGSSATPVSSYMCRTGVTYTDWSGASYSFGQAVFGCSSNANPNLIYNTLALPVALDDDQVGIEFDGSSYVQGSGSKSAELKPKILFPNGRAVTFDYTAHSTIDEDPDGNQIVITGPLGTGAPLTGASGTITDTLGRVVTVTSTGEQEVIGYSDGNGNPEQIVLTFNSPKAASAISLDPVQPAGSLGTYGGTSINVSNSLSSIVLPNKSTYTFQYDGLGELIKVTYPTGGYVRYAYQSFLHDYYYGVQPQNAGVESAFADTREVVAKYQCTAAVSTYGATSDAAGDNCSVPELVTTFKPIIPETSANNTSEAVTTPDGTVTTTTFNPTQPGCNIDQTLGTGYCGPYNIPMTSQTVVDASGATKRAASYQYSSTSGNHPSLVTTVQDGLTKEEQWQYQDTTLTNSSGATSRLYDVASDSVYNYSSSGAGPLIKEAQDTWNPVVYSSSGGSSFRAHEKHTEIVSGSSSTLSSVVYGYDGTSLYTPSNATAPEHDSAYTATGMPARGHVTSAVEGLSGNTVTTGYTYDIYGNVHSMTDTGRHTTSYSYTDSFGSQSLSACGMNAEADTEAYLTTVTNPLNQSSSASYLPCSGAMQSVTDPNSQTTSYSYDDYNRLLSVIGPEMSEGHPLTSYTYADASNTVTTTVSATPDPSRTTVVVSDGFGRPMQSLVDEQPGTIEVDTSYDNMGRVAEVSNPHTSTAEPTDGNTQYSYDALNRKTEEREADGSTSTWCYDGVTEISSIYCSKRLSGKYPNAAWVDVTDEAGHHKQSVFDAASRLVAVMEPDPASGADTLETDYQLDAMGKILDIDQWGGPFGSSGDRSRLFHYDGLSRLTSAQNPESGMVTYTYNASGGSLCSGDPSDVCSRTDARGIVTTYAYDTLNRLTEKSYSDGTLPVHFAYDQASASVHPGGDYGFGTSTLQNGIGRVTSEYVGTTQPGVAGKVFNYDAMGRSINARQCMDVLCTETPRIADNWHTYDLAGNVTYTNNSNGYGYGVTYDAAGRPKSMSLASDLGGTTTTLVSSVQYGPVGPLQVTRGSGQTETMGYDKRLRVTSYQLANTGSSSSAEYAYSLNYYPNSNVQNATESFSGSSSEWQYNYDDLDRLTSAVNAGMQKGCAFSYDNWGNRTSEAPGGSAGDTCFTQSATYPAGKNAVSGYCYDASGDLLDAGPCPSSGTHEYSYDAEGRLATAEHGSVSYVYDAEDRRVGEIAPSGTVDTVYDEVTGEPLQQYPGAGGDATAGNADVWFAGRHLGVLLGSTVTWSGTDWLGSERVRYNAAGTLLSAFESLPFGDGLTTLAGTDTDTIHYTGKERDTANTDANGATGLDYFGARFYSSQTGRFLSPDWSAQAEAVPYAKLDSPQSLNLYSYGGNNPTSRLDPTGHQSSICADAGLTGCSGLAWVPDGTYLGQDGAAVGQVTYIFGGATDSDAGAQQQNENTELAQNNTPPPPNGRTNSPAQGQEPNSTTTIPQPDGSTTTRTYGPDGKAVKDVDTHPDHGAGSPHAHDWDWGKKPPRQPGRPLTPEEQKNVKRAAGGVTAGVIIYWIISEGSRLFPPRNLIPVP